MMARGARAETDRVRLHDLPTWEGLVREQHARIYNLHLRLGAEPETAADLTQDSFEQAWRSAGSFRGTAQPSTWLYGVALNVNRHWRQRTGLTEPPEEGDLEQLPDPEPTAEELAVLGQHRDLLAQAVGRLPASLRDVVVMRYFMGVQATEIAREQGVAEGTVRWRLHTALRKLWVLLQPTLGKELSGDDPGEQGSDGTLRIAT